MHGKFEFYKAQVFFVHPVYNIYSSSIYDRLQYRSICKSTHKILTVEHIHAHLYIEFLHFQLTKGVQKSVNSDTRGQNVKIYSKLSTVMGVTWFLGFGAAHSTIVAYLYIIINSLQGKNVSKRRILKLDVLYHLCKLVYQVLHVKETLLQSIAACMQDVISRLVSFVETPRKFIIARLSIRKLESSYSVLIMY